jgi:hypothetical protein
VNIYLHFHPLRNPSAHVRKGLGPADIYCTSDILITCQSTCNVGLVPAPAANWRDQPPFAPGANWRVVPRPRRRGRHPYLFARVAAPRFPHRRPSPKSPSIATSQHPPGRQLATSLPPPLRASPGPIPGPESRSWAPMPWVRPPRATPWLRCTKIVTHGARDSADEDHPAKGSPLRTSSTPQVLYPRISYPRSRPAAFPSQAISAGSLLHRLTDQGWGSKWHTTVKVARKCWWGTFYYGGGPRHAFLLTNKGPVWANSRKFRDLAVWSGSVITANWRVRLKTAGLGSPEQTSRV